MKLFRSQVPKLVAVTAALLQPATASAVMIVYEETALGGNRFRHDYTVFNNDTPAGVEFFNVVYGEMTHSGVSLDMAPAGWRDSFISFPTPGLDHELFAGTSTIDGDPDYAPIELDTALSGFSVSFDWLGGGEPVTPMFQIFDAGFTPSGTPAGATSAELVFDIVTAPQKIGLLPLMGMDALRSQSLVATAELRRSRWGSLESGWLLAGDMTEVEYIPGFRSRDGAEDERETLSVGYTHKVSDNLLVGVVLSFGSSELEVGASEFEADTFGVTGLLGYRSGPLFLDMVASLTRLDYDDLDRDVMFGGQMYTATGDTDGRGWGLDALVGYDLLSDSAQFKLAPAFGYQAVNAKVDDYEESGAQILNNTWGKQAMKSQQWRFGVVGSAKLSETFSLHAEVFGAKERRDSLHSLEVTNNSLGFTMHTLPAYQIGDKNFWTANLGGTLDLGSGHVSLNYNYSSQGDDLQQVIISYSHPL